MGLDVIQNQLKTLPEAPGVYRMLDEQGKALYVGKAKNLRKRVTAYTHLERLPARLQRMVLATASMEIVTTHTEAEALLLESNLIKRLRPHFNILLKDDKSFPYILLGEGKWPRVMKHRGRQNDKGAYFGPFASASAVNQALMALQKAFLLRSCTDAVFAARTRPCLLHQIKRCCAPCVGRVTPEDYAALVSEARAFLAGDSSAIQKDLAVKMDAAAARLAYEEAAIFRDRIQALSRVQARQDVNLPGVGEADVIALHQAGGQACIQVFFFRSGQNCGNHAYFPSQTGEAEAGEILSAFLGQFYDDKPPPREVLLSHAPQDQALLGERAKLIAHALRNAREALERRMAESQSQSRLLDGVAAVFGLDAPPRRIEIYDNSHISGTKSVGGMVVAGAEGFLKAAYRTFHIKDTTIAAGDDFAMMREVLTRRFARALKEDPEREGATWPDLVLIDGGKGQLGVAVDVLAELGLEGEVPLVAVSKGPDRNAGREYFHQPGRESFQLPLNDPTLYYLQRLRDEAHRFAIGAHRARRSKAIGASPLEEIPGVGALRKKALLRHFGSARAISEAGQADLEAVEGVSAALAKKIYDFFHNSP